jgi:hypothetical protein
MNAPTLLAADGLPFAVRQFYLDGITPSLTAFLHADGTGIPVPIDTGAAGPRHDDAKAQAPPRRTHRSHASGGTSPTAETVNPLHGRVHLPQRM